MSELAPLISDLGDHPDCSGMCHNSVQMAQTACHPRLYSGRIHYRAVRQLPAQRNRYRQHQDLGRYRRYLPPFCHGTGIFIPETAECRIKCRYRHTHHCGRNDVLGYTAGNAMGFTHITSLFLGGMLSMSSTAIVFKAFNDMNLLQQKFTGIVLGILVVEDLVGVVMLVVLSTLAASQHFEGTALLGSLFKLIGFLIFWSALGIYLLPTFMKKIRQYISDEILLIVSLGLCLLMVRIAVGPDSRRHWEHLSWVHSSLKR